MCETYIKVIILNNIKSLKHLDCMGFFCKLVKFSLWFSNNISFYFSMMTFKEVTTTNPHE